eukprot:1724602-Alexandrium_andersonii.AAC.1
MRVSLSSTVSGRLGLMISAAAPGPVAAALATTVGGVRMGTSRSAPGPPGVKGNTLEPAAWVMGTVSRSGPSEAGTLEPAAVLALGVKGGNGPGLGMPG